METSYYASRVLEPGSIVDARYEITKKIASGGMATVYRALDLKKDQTPVALKVLHREFSDDKSYVQRFVREVKLIHGIVHPNIVRSYDIGTEDGMIYYTMEYIEGETLERMLERKRLSVSEISELIIQICRGLSLIHSLGIVHRDLKPANVLIAKDGTVKIVDFGVARDKSSRLTQPNQTVGSLCYISPEVWNGKRPGAAADFYGLGIMLYELVTGAVPFDNPLPGKMLELHLKGRVIPPIQVNSEVPKWLSELILKLLEKQPKDRPRSAQSIIELVELEVNRNKKTRVALRGEDDSDPAEPSILAKGSATDGITPIRDSGVDVRGKTYVFRLTATQMFDRANLEGINELPEAKRRRKATVILPLPRRSALVLEIEAPSQDVIFFGVFLVSLQVLDGFLTRLGVQNWGIQAEGNYLLRNLMHLFGPENALLAAKGIAIALVIFLTIIAKKQRVFKNVIGALSLIYLCAAIIPWFFILSTYYATHPIW